MNSIIVSLSKDFKDRELDKTGVIYGRLFHGWDFEDVDMPLIEGKTIKNGFWAYGLNENISDLFKQENSVYTLEEATDEEAASYKAVEYDLCVKLSSENLEVLSIIRLMA